MLRYASYARYSSDNQNDKSTEDQLNDNRVYVNSVNGILAPGNIFSDEEISASHIVTRPGVIAMMEAARKGLFDVLVIDDLSRLSRDQEDIAHIYKRLKFMEIKIFSLLEGEIDEMHIGFKGTSNALDLKKIAHGVRRGQRGAVKRGEIPGGNSYGYDVVREFTDKGEPVRGKRTVNTNEAAVVNRIFQEYVHGKSPRAIAKQLNKECIEGPRGGQWQASTINGNPKRRTGILNNDLYNGQIIYNRQRFIKHPDTGKRQARLNPKEEWVIQDVQELRIVPKDLWGAVQKRRKEVAIPNSTNHRRAKYLLSGLLSCGCCNGSYVIVSGSRHKDERRYGCSTRKEKGTCENSRTISLHELENRVFEGLKTYLSQPIGLRTFVQEFHLHLRDMESEKNKERTVFEKKLDKTNRKIKSIIGAIEDGLYNPDMKEHMAILQADKERINLQLEQFDNEDDKLTFLPNLGEAYEKYVDDLRATLNRDQSKTQATELLRSLIERIILVPEIENEGLYIEIEGKLASILHFIQGNKTALETSLKSWSSLAAVAGDYNRSNRTNKPNCATAVVAEDCNTSYRAFKPLRIKA